MILAPTHDEKVILEDREAIICLDNLNVIPGWAARERKLEVAGGAEDAPLRLHVSTDYINLIILSGHVDIVFTGRRRSKVYLSKTSNATISVSSRQKIILEGQGAATVIVGGRNKVQDYTRSNKVNYVGSK